MMATMCYPGRASASTAVAVAVLIVLAAGSTANAQQEPWTLAVIGDQQYAVDRDRHEEFFTSFTAKTDWLAANAQANNIRFVAQVGDIVENAGHIDEWDRTAVAMATLDTGTNADGGTGIPWNVAYGNHERLGNDDPQSPAANLTYRQYFGSENATTTHRYADQPGFGGESSNGLNNYHIITSSSAPDAREYLMLNLEYDVPGHQVGSTAGPGDIPMFDAIAWAQEMIDQHPGMPTIINTHVFEGTAFGPPNNPYTSEGIARNSQVQIFDKLIRDNSQVFMVVSGHTSQDTHRIRSNAAGLPVLQISTDYTKVLPNAGDGFMRLIELDEEASEVRVETFTPGVPQNPTPRYMTTSNGQFTWNLDWAVRFDGAPPPPPEETTPVLVSHWNFDDGQSDPNATVVADQVPSAPADGVYMSSIEPWWVEGRSGGAMQLDGQIRHVAMAGHDKLDLTEAVTLAAWVRIDGTPTSNYGVIAGKDQGGGAANDGYYLKHVTAGGADHIEFAVTSDNVNTSIRTTQIVPDLTNVAYAEGNEGFIHVVGVFDPGRAVEIYVNGILDDQNFGAPLAQQSTSASFQVGQHYGATTYRLNGAVDDVQVYSSAFSPEQVALLYANPGQTHPESIIPDYPEPEPPPPGTGVVGHWKLDDGQAVSTATWASDSVEEGAAHGTLTNFPSPPQWGEGVAGGALRFGTATDRLTRVVVDDDPQGKMDIEGELTISAWIQSVPEFTLNSTRHIAGKDQSGGPTGDAFSLKHTMGGSADLVQFLIASGGVNTNLSGSKTLSEYTADSVAADQEGWILVTGVFRPGESMQLYINGELDAELTEGVPIDIDLVSTPFTIGRLWHASNTTAYTFQGSIDDVQLYDVALDSSDIQYLYLNPGESVDLTPVGLPGDVNGDGTVDRADAALLLQNLGRTDAAGGSDGDFTGDGNVGLADLAVVQANLGDTINPSPATAVPEPASIVLLICAAALSTVGRRRHGSATRSSAR